MKTEYLLQGFMMMKYAAVNLGYRDFLYGTKFIEEMQQNHGVPFVSTNIYDKESGKPFVNQYIIKRVVTKGGRDIRVGIIGLERQNSNLIPALRRQGGALLEARDPVVSAREAIHHLKNRVDLLICLAHMRLEEAKQLAAQLPEVNVFILGNDYRNQEVTVNGGNAMIVSAGRQGKYIGDLTIQFDAERHIIAHKHRAAPLDKSYQDDPRLAALVNKYKKAIKK